MNTFVYSYGCKPPAEGTELIDGQVKLAHAYYNRLVELRRAERAERDGWRASLCPEVENAEAAASAAGEAVEACVSDIRRRNAAGRRKRATAEESAELAGLKELRAVAWAGRKEAVAAAGANPALQMALAAVHVDYHGEVVPGSDPPRRRGGHYKEARADCGVHFGTYLEIEKAVEQAAKTAAKFGGPPSFRRWTGDGLVGVQVQKGIDVGTATGGTDNRFRLVHERGRGRRAPLYVAWLRLASEGRAPVWAKVPFYMHRPLPDDALIMGAILTRRQVAVRRHAAEGNPDGEWRPYYEWSLNVTLRTGLEKPRATSGACGVDLGWRLMGDGSLRVAYVVGSDGDESDVRLPASLLARFRRCDDLREIRDGHFNEAKAWLGAWVAEQGDRLPGWLREEVRTLPHWRRKGRLARLLAAWAGQRFPGDGAGFALLAAWQGRDAHLWQYEAANRRKAQAIRKDAYRALAARLRTRYRSVTVEDCDWRTLARLPAPDDNSVAVADVRYHQRVASAGMLRGLLKQDGAKMVAAANTTRTCHRCGGLCVEGAEGRPIDYARNLVVTCPHCEQEWDQDRNGAINLLASGGVVDESPGAARGPEGVSGGEDAAVEAQPRGRWQRRKANRSRALPQGEVGA